MLIIYCGNLKNTSKNFNRVAIDVFLPARSAGKKICGRLRASAAKKR